MPIHRSKGVLAISSGLLCFSVAGSAMAQQAAPAPGTPAAPAPAAQQPAAGGSVSLGGSSAGGTFGGSADANAPGAAAPSETEWVGWNTGGEDANYGLGLFGHLGLGYRIGETPLGDPLSRTGLRIGITGVVRLNRYFGIGLGYEHADLDHDRADFEEEQFQDIYRDANSLWLQGRLYPVRVDPVAVYVALAGGPAWQSLDANSLRVVPDGTGETLVNVCSGSDSVALGLRGGVGAEFTFVSGAMLWAELGPDFYAFSEEPLDGCSVGAGETPQFGFRAGFAFGMEKTKKQAEPLPPPADTDGDTIIDPQDACPQVAGVPNADPAKNGCPSDKDGDGFLDAQDACPDVPGIAHTDATKNGCPAPGDTDGDGVTDDVDACREIPGIATQDPATNGCPGDKDGDGFRDDQDACPEEKGLDDADPTKRGCPKLVRVTDTEIIILEQVQFDTGKATIKPASDPLLDSVASVLKEHAEILKLEVQGHTDSKGAAQLNKRLSQERADSVRKALEKRGVEAARLVGKGYGPEKPIADNATEEGRSKNRRVQFVVLEKKPKAVPMPAAAAAAPAAPPAAAPAAAPAAPAVP